jgi:conjugative transfer signal peptidase TraF
VNVRRPPSPLSAPYGHRRPLLAYLSAMLCGVTLIAYAGCRSAAPVLLFNPSASAPRGWYLLSPDAPTRVGQLAFARMPTAAAQLAAERGYLPLGTNLLKSVAALHGDYVCADGAQVRINRRIVAKPLTDDSQHRPLYPWRGCLVLPARRYFLLSPTNLASFDSRYFGPLEREAIVGRAVPLWTWP